MSFLKYIGSLRELTTASGPKRFVLGNSGADYDSIIGSMIYAFFMTQYLRIPHIPLVDCPENDIPLRFQVEFVLQEYGITKHNLIYTEMIEDLYSNQNHTFLLYDHNSRPIIPKNQIAEIIDHHAISDTIQCSSVIETCGSALTLLFYLYNSEKIDKFHGSNLFLQFQTYRNFTKNMVQNVHNYDSQIDQLLYYGIMLDTFKFSPSQKGRWNEYDLYAVEQITSRVKPRLQIQQIEAIKTSLKYSLALSLVDHLRKDFKQIRYGSHTVKYSVIIMNPHIFIEKYWNQLQSLYNADKMEENTVYVLMFAYTDEFSKLKRQMILSGKDHQFIMVMEKLLRSINMIKKQNVGSWNRWDDPTTKISRKLFDSQLKAFI